MHDWYRYYTLFTTLIFTVRSTILEMSFGEPLSLAWISYFLMITVECPSAGNAISIITDVLQSASGKSVSLARLWPIPISHLYPRMTTEFAVRRPRLMDPRPFLGISFAHRGWKPAAVDPTRIHPPGGWAIQWPLVSKLLRFPSVDDKKRLCACHDDLWAVRSRSRV